MVWTVNHPDHMMEVYIYVIRWWALTCRLTSGPQAVRWGVDVILTDVTQTWLDLRGALYCTRHHLILGIAHAL